MRSRYFFSDTSTGRSRRFTEFRAVRAGLLTPLVLFSVTLLHMGEIQASAGGRTSFSGNPDTNAGATCSVCHAPDGAAVPTVTITGPQTIDAGTSHDYTVTVTGGPAQTAGVGISTTDGIGELLPDNSDLQQMDGELTHTGPKGFSGGTAIFDFQYTAPNYDAAVILYAAGNSTNGGLDLVGDGIGTETLAITIENGFEPPPDPPTPASGQLKATLFATGLSSPVVIENAGDDRLFVVERAGRIRIVEPDGSVLSQSFLDIRSQVKDNASEEGLLGLAFHPNYESNGYFFVYYTRDPGPGNDRTVVSRFSVGSSNPNVANPASELILMEFEQPYSNHNGGDIHFGPQGYLHIASGDGGSGGDPQNYGQTTTTLLGKMLRIDVDTAPAAGTGPDCEISGSNNYSIPPGNAFSNGAGAAGCDEIYIIGVRNPWRFAFDEATGAMWIADVGQNAHEEINYLPPGENGGLNLGWRCYEGTAPFDLSNCNLIYLPPVHTFPHSEGCSITGGRVYRSESTPFFQGQYFFSDFCESSIRALSGSPGNLSHRIVLPVDELSSISTFGEDQNGDLYVAELNTGRIYRLDPSLPPGCG